MFSNRSRIQTLDGDGPSLGEQGAERLLGSPIAGHFASFSNDKSARLDAIRLKIVLVDPVVADEGIGQKDDLARIARVAENLLVAGHSRIENDLADGNSFGAEGP